ncbi:putative mitochondrial 50S ribosomal protein L53-like protein [Leptotrombidium deliense]|uniref:Putative mitochondrial 50S ribosomal protein L53-like protein n=1 Tax=Leptotrombidium deliense TaxID=299467 RepID=A0A443SAR8_9ACAR|nr:putative mitochondrial 50S ribosomal protein L53-like protein [Leptotrombidium deliense]
MEAYTKKSYHASVQIFRNIYGSLPHFSDVFDEESFYVFVVLFVLATIAVAVILSRFITLKESDI